MTLKKCSCGKLHTTKTAEYSGWSDLGPMLVFLCHDCKSSFVIVSKSGIARANRITTKKRKAS